MGCEMLWILGTCSAENGQYLGSNVVWVLVLGILDSARVFTNDMLGGLWGDRRSVHVGNG